MFPEAFLKEGQSQCHGRIQQDNKKSLSKRRGFFGLKGGHEVERSRNLPRIKSFGRFLESGQVQGRQPWSRPQARNTPGALVHEPVKAKQITLDSRQEF